MCIRDRDKLILKGSKKFIFLLKIKFDATEYLNKLKTSNSYFHTFINRESLAVGVIFLKPGENDTQDPHDSDEIYYILDGNGFLEINNESYRLKKGQAILLQRISLTTFMVIQKIFQFCIFLAVLILSQGILHFFLSS